MRHQPFGQGCQRFPGGGFERRCQPILQPVATHLDQRHVDRSEQPLHLSGHGIGQVGAALLDLLQDLRTQLRLRTHALHQQQCPRTHREKHHQNDQ